MEPQIYHITANTYGWLFPLLGISGILIIIIGSFVKWRPMLIMGPVVTGFGAIPEHDISLLAGAVLASAGLWFLARPAKRQGPKKRGPEKT